MKQILLIQKSHKTDWLWPADDPPDPIDLECRTVFVSSRSSDRIAVNGWWIAIWPDCIILQRRNAIPN